MYRKYKEQNLLAKKNPPKFESVLLLRGGRQVDRRGLKIRRGRKIGGRLGSE
jgi:hypothetical protein